MNTASAHADQPAHAFTQVARDAIYHAIFSRRDVRGQYLPKPVSDAVLSRILMAAHHAPSVGFMQPWNFLVVRAPEAKQRVHAAFAKAHAEASEMFDDDKRTRYRSLKLEGILESPVGICLTCDRNRTGPVVLGRTHMKTMDLYSSVCAVQNLWLAARAEGLGVGWVSIFHQADLQEALGIPKGITPIAYLCVGYVSHFFDKPELETAGWLPRLPMQELVYFDQWGQRDDAQPLIAQLQQRQAALQNDPTGSAFASESLSHLNSQKDSSMTSMLPVLSDLAQPALTASLQDKLNNKTKPLGSLGRIEDLALKIGQILGTENPVLDQPQMVVFAADHGLAARGVSAFPSDVTWQMVENFLAGGAAVSVLARQHGLALTVVDCGVKHDFLAGLPAGSTRPSLQVRKAAWGTADSSQGPAMTRTECETALAHGMELVCGLPGNALLLGEMGIANTSAASLLLAKLTGLDIVQCTGAGTGLDAPAVQRKAAVLREVLERHADKKAPLDVLAAVGGLEIATMVGAVLQAASERRVVVVDGFIATSAVLVAHALQPLVLQRCVFAHRSGERGHEFMLQHLGVQALLDLGLRLGEGSGAALAWPLLQSACAVLREMASFATAGVSDKSGEVPSEAAAQA